MKSRMEKYYEEEGSIALREKKNQELYENISNFEVEDYHLDSNATIIGEDAHNIDVEKIKKILDNKYNKEPKRRSIVIEEEKEDPIISLDETREYDINAILEKARSEKEADYDHERFKKLRDTQYDILNSLDLENKSEVKSAPAKEEVNENKELMELINTITARELSNDIKKEIAKEKEPEEELDPLDILTELKGEDNTVVVGGAKVDDSISETSPVMSLQEADEIKAEMVKEDTNSFTNSLQFTQSDFDDFNDLKKEVNSNKALIYVIVVLVSLILIAGLLLFLNKFLNLSIF